MSRIRLLSETTVNRIAAGEVIERPAAATKELVENALDAGATRIVVCLDGGGIDRLEVTDNGIGMSEDELALCVLRHATSKLTDETLVRITTLGFRGEALPSIGAAARLQITSRTREADNACVINVEGGHVSAVVRRLALSAPHVAFRLELDGRVAFELPVQERINRVAALLGPDAAAVMLPVHEERAIAGRDGAEGVLRIGGYLCAPSVTRATPVAQTLIVNNRPVADPVLRTAVKVGYRDVIAFGRHAIVVLYLDVPPDELDVNVHPAKTELRFRDAAAIRSLVIGSLRRALGAGTGHVVAMPSFGAAAAAYSDSFPDSVPGGFTGRPALTSWARPGRPSYPAPSLSLTAGGAPYSAALAEAQLPLMAGPAARQIAALAPSPDFPLGAPVAQVLDTYIIAVAADGSLVLVDQHAAHERLTHEAIRTQILDGAVRTQPLLLPAVVDMPQGDVARLVARTTELARLGLDLEEFGPGAILVRALPAVLGTTEPGPLLRDLADEFADMDEQTTLSARLDAVIARMACHGSIRAGRKLGQAEMSALLRQMEDTPRAATCSHGRPTVLKLSKADIEKMFGRR
jgi:DNA mismatch repair protein MutL